MSLCPFHQPYLIFLIPPQGVLLGLSNTAGVLAGVFGTAATGYILQRGSSKPPSSLAFL